MHSRAMRTTAVAEAYYSGQREATAAAWSALYKVAVASNRLSEPLLAFLSRFGAGMRAGGECMKKCSRFTGFVMMLLGPIVLLKNLSKPRLAALHGSDVLGLVASGLCLGIGFGQRCRNSLGLVCRHVSRAISLGD